MAPWHTEYLYTERICEMARAGHKGLKSERPCVVLCLVAQLCPTLCDPINCSPPGSSVHGNSPGKNTGVGCHALLQGIFPTQGSNVGLLHCRQILYQLSYQGSLRDALLTSKVFDILITTAIWFLWYLSTCHWLYDMKPYLYSWI